MVSKILYQQKSRSAHDVTARGANDLSTDKNIGDTKNKMETTSRALRRARRNRMEMASILENIKSCAIKSGAQNEKWRL